MSMELCFLTPLITKASTDQFGLYPLAKMFLYFGILTWLPTLNLESFLITSLIESFYALSLTLTGFILLVLWHVLLYSSTISYNLLIYTFFDIEVMYMWILAFKVLINLSATTDFTSLCIEYIFMSLPFNHFLKKLL